LRIISSVCVSVDAAVLHLYGEHTKTTLEDVIYADRHGIHLPEVASLVLEKTTVACASHKARGFIHNGAIITIGKRTHRRIRHSIAVAISRIFRTRNGIRKVILSTYFVYPSALKMGASVLALVYISRTLEATGFPITLENIHGALQHNRGVFGVKLACVERCEVAQTLVAVKRAVVVHKQCGVKPIIRTSHVHPRIGITGIIRIKNSSTLGVCDIYSIAKHRRSRSPKLKLREFLYIHLNKFPTSEVGGNPVT
jgi:hypothetical protein